VRRLHVKIEKARNGTLPAAGSQIALQPFMDRWLEQKRTRVRARTLANYEGHCRVHIYPRFGSVMLHELSTGHVQDMINQVLASGCTPTTAQRVRATLRSCLADAIRARLLVQNVAALTPPPRARPKPATWLDAEQAKRFLDVALGDPVGDLLSLILLLGLRRGEAQGLK